MKKILFIAVVVSALFAWANELPSKKISMEAKSLGTKDALVSLLKDSGLNYNIHDEVKNEKIISLQAKDMPWNQLFKVITDQAHLKYQFNNKGILQISQM